MDEIMNDIIQLKKDLEALKAETRDLRARLDRTPGGYRPPEPPPRKLIVGAGPRPKPRPKPKPVPDPPHRDPISEAFALRRKAAYSEHMAKIYGDADRTRAVAAEIANLTDRIAGLVIALSDDGDFCHTLSEALHRHNKVGAAILTNSTPEEQRVAVLGRVKGGFVRVAIVEKKVFDLGAIGLQGVGALYLAAPIKMDVDFTPRMASWLIDTDRKHFHLKLTGHEDTGVDALHDNIIEHQRDRLGRLR